MKKIEIKKSKPSKLGVEYYESPDGWPIEKTIQELESNPAYEKNSCCSLCGEMSCSNATYAIDYIKNGVPCSTYIGGLGHCPSDEEEEDRELLGDDLYELNQENP